jgi:hypothetical protein
MSKERKNLKIALLVSGLLLCLAVIPIWPSGYYSFLKLVVCSTTVFAAFILKDEQSLSKHFIPFVIVAIVFNPFYPILLTQLIWVILYLALAVYFLQVAKRINTDS